MADNYLEKRYDEIFSGNNYGSNSGRSSGRSSSIQGSAWPTLDRLLLKNRSYRGYDSSYKVHPLQMKAILGVNCLLASGMNAQTLRFHPVTDKEEATRILPLIHIGGALPDLHLPFPGTEPQAFVIVFSTKAEGPVIDIDLGISLQSMLLKAVELGLGGLIIRNFDGQLLKAALNLDTQKAGSLSEPLAVLAIGKPAEKIKLSPAHCGDSLKYWREDGVHYVPKLGLEDLLI